MSAPEGKYTWTATVGEKGQIVIPKQAREIFGISPGDTLLLLGDEKRGIAIGEERGEKRKAVELALKLVRSGAMTPEAAIAELEANPGYDQQVVASLRQVTQEDIAG